MNETLLHADITQQVIKAYYHVYNTMGVDFLEKVYENALLVTLRKAGFTRAQQVAITVYFEGEIVGEYFADLIVNDAVILEIKAADSLDEAHETQLVNYLRATRIEAGLVLNFG